jgi:hypothetical protein
MIPQADFVEAIEVEQVRSWIMSQDEEVQEAVALEVARLRVFEASKAFLSLRFVHSESTRKAALEGLRKPSVAVAFEVLEIDPDKFAHAADFVVRKLGTTRPDGFWRACGVGRPKGKKQ